MKTKLLKRILSSCFLVIFLLQSSFADDVRLKIPVTSINNLLSSLIESKYLSYGTSCNISTDFGTITYYSIKPQSISLQTYAGNTFDITIVADAMANFNPSLVIPDFDFVLGSQSITISGTVNLSAQGTGYKIVFAPTAITYNNNNWLKPVIQHQLDGIVPKLPEISTSSNQPLLPSVIASYFTSGTPTLTTTSTEIILGLTLAAGPRWITVQNEANQRIDLGKVQEVQNGVVVGTYDSPHTFDTWYTNDAKQVQSRDALIASTNGQNKYKNWFKNAETSPQTDIALRRIQLTVGSSDATYAAKFPQAQRVQLSNLLEGSYSGGTVTYNGTTVASFDDYDYKGISSSINTTVPNGTLGTNWVFSNWSDGNTSQSRNITLSGDINLTANYKGIHISNQPDAYDNPSQRKVARSAATSYYTNGILHLVYESSGKIWYETSRDNGATWNLENNGQPLNTFTAKNPSIAPLLGSHIAIVFEEDYAGSGYPIIKFIIYDAYNHIKKYDGYVKDKFNNDIFIEQYATQTIEPVIAVNTSSGKFIIVWKQEDVDGLPIGGLFSAHGSFWNGDWQYSTVTWNGEYDSSSPIPGTNSSSYHPTINSFITPAADSFAVAWEQRNGTSSSHIYYRRMKWNTDQITFEPAQNISSASGYTFNEHPSFITYPDLTARIVWRGRRSTEGELAKASVSTEQKVTLFKSTDYYRYWSFGQNVASPYINTSSDRYVIAWSENSGSTNKYADNRTLSTVYTLNTTGENLQVTNGETANSMYVLSHQTQGTPPYRFYTSNNIASFGKSEQSSIANGREGVIAKGNAQIYFALGDVSVDDIPIQFRAIEDSVVFTSLSTVNNYLVTEPFTLTPSSQLYYGIECGTADTSGIAEALPADARVRFKVELIDAATKSVIGAFDDVKFSASSLMPYRNIAYSVDTKGIAKTTAQLRLTVEAPPDVEYSIKEKFADGSVLGLGKTVNHRKHISYQGSLAVTDYALAQNYPNPFNPNTTISYALPKDGMVSIKIYDALGREVKTLVNEYKSSGRYTTEFDASRLASGIYIYKLVSGDYSAVKKMMLLK